MNTDERERLKDDKAVHSIISEWCGEGTIGVMRHKIVEYLSTVRQEERRAAWDKAVQIVKTRLATLQAQTATLDGIAGAACLGRDVAIEEIVRDLEAAANEPKEKNDGPNETAKEA